MYIIIIVHTTKTSQTSREAGRFAKEIYSLSLNAKLLVTKCLQLGLFIGFIMRLQPINSLLKKTIKYFKSRRKDLLKPCSILIKVLYFYNIVNTTSTINETCYQVGW